MAKKRNKYKWFWVCPGCEKQSDSESWEEDEITDCEACSDVHPAVKCPKCGYLVDLGDGGETLKYVRGPLNKEVING